MHRIAPLVVSLSFALGSLACGERRNPPSSEEFGASAGTSSANGGAASNGDGGGKGGSIAAGGADNGWGGAATGTAGNDVRGIAGEGGAGSLGNYVSLLVFSRTVEYRHDSIPAGVAALTKLASARGWQLSATEDASTFSDTGLAPYNAVIFLSTTGNVLDDAQQAAFERFIRSGNGYIGIHSATDTEYDWPWYGGLVGAYFREHPSIQTADVLVEDPAHAATMGLPNPWRHTDEWYAFQSNPRANVRVLLSLDESSYEPGSAHMNGDHPIAWCHEYDGGRAFYTGLGHTSESYADPAFMGQLAGAVVWVLAR